MRHRLLPLIAGLTISLLSGCGNGASTMNGPAGAVGVPSSANAASSASSSTGKAPLTAEATSVKASEAPSATPLAASKQVAVPPGWNAIKPGTLLVIDTPTNRVISVSPIDGTQRVVSPAIPGLSGIACAGDGTLYASIYGSPGRIVRIEPDTGQVVPISEGGLLAFVLDLAVEPTGTIVASQDAITGPIGLTRVDASSGAQALLLGGLSFTLPAVAVSSSTGMIYASRYRSVLKFDPTTGATSTISVTALEAATDIAVSRNGPLYLADTDTGYVHYVSPGGGASAILNIGQPFRLGGVAVDHDETVYAGDRDLIWRKRQTEGWVPITSGGELQRAGRIEAVPSMLLSVRDLAINLRAGTVRLNGVFARATSLDVGTLALAVTLRGSGGWVIPPGAFRTTGNGTLRFNGKIEGGVQVNAEVRPLGGNQYALAFDARGATLSEAPSPVIVEVSTALLLEGPESQTAVTPSVVPR